MVLVHIPPSFTVFRKTNFNHGGAKALRFLIRFLSASVVKLLYF